MPALKEWAIASPPIKSWSTVSGTGRPGPSEQVTLDIGTDGEVRPRRLRKNINAVENAREFLRLNPPNYIKKDAADIELSDGIRAGSNAPGVLALFDGDMETYWEPDALELGVDLATQWWFIVDLGRFVMARKIVLKFVDEALGDPFLQFDVLVSEGRQPKGNSRSETPEFRRVARTLVPNKHQRLFEIELEYAEEFAGMGLRFVQVLVTGSDFAHGREISRDEYEALLEADRGAILYHKLLPNGNEAAVKKAVYDRLEASRQGPVRYFVRERPRLAELEVWAEGDEILINTVERGGMVTSTQSLALASLFDGDVLSFSEVIFIFSPGQLKSPEGEVFFDMGASFWIDAFRMALGARQRNFEGYRLDFSNGEREADGSLKWTSAAAVSGAEVLSASTIGTQSVMGNNFSPLRARFFRFVWNQIVRGVGNSGAAILADPSELQLYGEGFMSEVSLTSDLVRLGGSRNLVSLEWDADVPPGTSVLVQTRTGNELAENLRYFKKDGTEVSKDQYDKLLSIFKGDIIAEEVVGGDWSDWSQPGEDPSGSPITSPSPREFLEIRATLLSDAPSASATLRSIWLNFTHPVAQSLTGEVAPAVVETLGQEQRFSLFVRPNFAPRDPGFDELLLVAPADMTLGFDGLYAGAGEVLAGRDMDGLAIADVEVVGDERRQPALGFSTDRAGVRDRGVATGLYHGTVCGRSGAAGVAAEQHFGGMGLAAGGSGRRSRGRDQQHHDLEGRIAEPILVGGRGDTGGLHSQWGWGQRPSVVPFQGDQGRRRQSGGGADLRFERSASGAVGRAARGEYRRVRSCVGWSG